MEKLTKKEEGFVKDYIDTGNGTQSVKNHYEVKNDNVAGVIAHQNLRKAKILEYIEDKAEVAASVIYTLATTSENDAIKLNASKDILDRGGFKPVEKSINLNIEAEITNPKARELAEKYEEELKKGL